MQLGEFLRNPSNAMGIGIIATSLFIWFYFNFMLPKQIARQNDSAKQSLLEDYHKKVGGLFFLKGWRALAILILVILGWILTRR